MLLSVDKFAVKICRIKLSSSVPNSVTFTDEYFTIKVVIQSIDNQKMRFTQLNHVLTFLKTSFSGYKPQLFHTFDLVSAIIAKKKKHSGAYFMLSKSFLRIALPWIFQAFHVLSEKLPFSGKKMSNLSQNPVSTLFSIFYT